MPTESVSGSVNTLASCKMKHLYLRKEFVLEAMLQTSRLLIPRCSKAYGAELCSLPSLLFRGKASLIMVLNNMALSLWGLDIYAAGDISAFDKCSPAGWL